MKLGANFRSAVLDHDTRDVPGSPDIGATILAKIDVAAVFVADVTLVVGGGQSGRKSPNPNVLFELGYAWGKLGADRVVLVLNEHFGAPEELPFDLRSKRVLKYSNDPAVSERSDAKKSLSVNLEAAIKRVLIGQKKVSGIPTQLGATLPIAPPNSAARHVVDLELQRVQTPKRTIFIGPLAERAVEVDRLDLARQVGTALPADGPFARAGLPLPLTSPRRSPDGFAWFQSSKQSPGDERPEFERVLGVGFDGSLIASSHLTEMLWRPEGGHVVDIGFCIDSIVALIFLSTYVRHRVGLGRPAKGTFYLDGISGYRAIFTPPSGVDLFFPVNDEVAHQSAVQADFDVTIDFSEDVVQAAVESVMRKLEYVFGMKFNRDYTRSRAAIAFAETH